MNLQAGSHYHTLVVGAGPAGLMAAIEAYAPDTRILLLEKMQRPALKLRISGKGRCNITNEEDRQQFLNRFGKNGRFLKYSFAQFFNHDLLEYLNSMGVPTKLERGGRYFPQSDRATDIVDAFVRRLSERNIPLITRAPVTGLRKNDHGSFLIDLLQADRPVQITADRVCLTTGGLSYPATGSTGDGYRMARKLGHHIVRTSPSLVPVLTAGDTALRLQGVSLRNVTVSIWSGNKKVRELFGEMMFTRKGVTGPVILTLSETMVNMLDAGREVLLKIDLKPALDHQKLDQRLLREIAQHGRQTFKNMLKSLLPRKMIDLFVDILQIAGDKQLHQISATERKRLRLLFKALPLQVIGHDSYDHAIVTAGGISLKEINPTTMESKVIPGLYFAGEIIDVNGETGGYNLTSSWSTAFVAGRAMRQAAGERETT